MKIAILFSVLAASVSLFAQESSNQKFFMIQNIQTEEVASETLNLRPVMQANSNCASLHPMGGPLDEVEMALDKIINMGKKIWAIVEAGKPVLNFKSDVATALPKGATCWTDLAGWQAPISKTYRITASNYFGMDVVNFQYRIIYVYGGNVDGVGQYLGYATMQPVDVTVAWGFEFNANGNVPVVFNTGTKSAPVAAMQMNMLYTIGSPLTANVQSQAYFITGKGDFKRMK
jgi:hypothetical protein